MNPNLLQKIKNIPRRIRNNGINILVVLVWSFVIAILVSRAYVDFIYSTPIYRWWETHGGVAPPFYTWQGPGLAPSDILIISIAGMISGAILCEVDKLVYGWLSTLVLSSAIASVYIANFIWSVLGWEYVLSLTDAGWSWALYWGFLNTFRSVFPIAVFFSFIAVVAGAFLRLQFHQA